MPQEGTSLECVFNVCACARGCESAYGVRMPIFAQIGSRLPPKMVHILRRILTFPPRCPKTVPAPL